ncbi:MAG: ABC transporter ATP-binding protein [Candidatus Dormibacteria bacterium]
MPDPPPIQVDHLTKRFGRLTAVSDLSLEVRGGEIAGFLGPNGAGKTTTIRVLMGFIKPTGGSSSVLGGSSARHPAVRRRIGYLPGDFRADLDMTGAELLKWFGDLRGGVDRSRVADLTERLRLDPSRKFGALSKGNRQKVGLVQAFMHDPDVLILDEPTSGLDPLMQHEFLLLVRDAAARGAAVLFSSHVLPEVERIATKVAIIRAGKLVTVSTVDELLDHARRHLELHFAAPVSQDLFRGVPGVASVDLDGRTATVAIDGPVGPALRAATEAAVLLRVNSAGDDLEDLFLSMYEPAVET